jgi:hypothetical protein
MPRPGSIILDGSKEGLTFDTKATVFIKAAKVIIPAMTSSVTPNSVASNLGL